MGLPVMKSFEINNRKNKENVSLILLQALISI